MAICLRERGDVLYSYFEKRKSQFDPQWVSMQNPGPERVWLARHAETAAPAIFHGAESDIGLSELGRQQAQAAATWFRERRPTIVVSSAMIRAIDTAAPIAAACGCPHVIVPELHERRVGRLSGTSFSVREGAWPDTVRQWVAGHSAYTTPGAESFDALSERLLPAWTQTLSRFPQARMVIIAHGVVCKVLLLNLLEGRSVRDWETLGRVANLSVSELVPVGETWSAEQLLQVPSPVALLSQGIPTGVGIRSEA
ncbi:MAG: histidine phosphatase family protein [Bacteroidales bacterium]|nr:histidine phosphatase family protein [Bacteroidales bacterium]